MSPGRHVGRRATAAGRLSFGGHMDGCNVCGRPRRKGSVFCSAHEQRKTRLGSATARQCVRCKDVVDDEETRELRQGQWKCSKCRCRACGKSLPRSKRRDAKFCNQVCQTRFWKQSVADLVALKRWGSVDPLPETCFFCNKVYVPKKLARGRQLFCSVSCQVKNMRRRKVTA